MEAGGCLFEAENVVAGKTALGRPSMFGPIPIAKGHVNICHGAALARRVMTVLADRGDFSFLPDDVRTAVHFKILAHISREGNNFNYANTMHAAWRIASFLVDHPRAVTSKAGFLRLEQMAIQHEHERENQAAEATIDFFRAESGAPERPAVWVGGIDGAYRLEELVHPFHIWEEGKILRNCLADVAPGSVHARTPDDLERLHYWRLHKRGLALYALRKRNQHLGVVTIHAGRVLEFHLSPANDQLPERIWRELHAFLTKVHGPLSHDGQSSKSLAARLARR